MVVKNQKHLSLCNPYASFHEPYPINFAERW